MSRIKSKSPPFHDVGDIIAINNTEIIIYMKHQLYKYNTIKQKWTKMNFKFPHNLPIFTTYSIAFNKTTNTLYICDSQNLISINLDTFTYRLPKLSQTCSSCPQIFIINDKIHLLSINEHFILNSSSMSIIAYFKFNKCRATTPVYLRSKKSIFARNIQSSLCLMTYKYCCSMSIFSTSTNAWIHQRNKKPKITNLLTHIGGAVLTKNEDYILYVRMNMESKHEWKLKDISDDILVYNVKKNEFRMAMMKLPNVRKWYITTTINDHVDKMITSGFVNGCYRMKEFQGAQTLPYYLVDLIKKWASFERVHVIGFDPKQNSGGKVDHYTMKLHRIISSTFPIELD